MSIDTTGKWWVGTDPADIGEYLEAYTQDAYPVKEFRLARCSCGSETFRLEVDHEEETAKRRCVVCSEEHFVGDSEEYWKNAQPKKWSCIECRSDQANIGVGFSLYDDGEVHWLYLGERWRMWRSRLLCRLENRLFSFPAPDRAKLVVDGASNKRLQLTAHSMFLK